MKLLPAGCGQRLLDPVLRDMLASLVVANPHIDVLPLGNWLIDMYTYPSAVMSAGLEGRLDRMEMAVFGGQHYRSCLDVAFKIRPALLQMIVDKPTTIYAFGLLSTYNDLKYLVETARQHIDEASYQLTQLKDIGLKTGGVVADYKERYSKHRGKFETWQNFMNEWISQHPEFKKLSDEDFNFIPSTTEALVMLVTEHNEVRSNTVVS
jgi:hypothetical protein